MPRRQDDPLAGYSPDWRERLGVDVTDDVTVQEDPLAGYDPSWRETYGTAPLNRALLAERPELPPPAAPAAPAYGVPPVNLDERGEAEERFRQWYQGHAQALDLDPDPDNPRHFYDWRAAWRAGASPDAEGHWPSDFKILGHPNMVVDGVDTRTGRPWPPPVDMPQDATDLAPPPLSEPQAGGLRGIAARLGELFGTPDERPIGPIVEAGPGAAEVFQPGEQQALEAERRARLDVPFESDFMRGLQTGLQGASAGVGETLENIGSTLDRPGLEDFGRTMSDEARRRQQVQAPRVERVEDISSLQDFVDWAAFQMGQGLGSTAGPVAGGIAGGVVGGPVGAVAGAAVPSYTMLLGEARGELEELGVDPDTIDAVAPIVAVPAAALESLLPATVGRTLTRQITAKFGRDLARRLVLHAAQGAVVEGLTEAGQEAITAGAGAALSDEREFFTPETMSRLVNAALAGALPGAAFGALGAAGEGRLAPEAAADPLEGYTPDWREQIPEADFEVVSEEAVPESAALPPPAAPEVTEAELEGVGPESVELPAPTPQQARQPEPEGTEITLGGVTVRGVGQPITEIPAEPTLPAPEPRPGRQVTPEEIEAQRQASREPTYTVGQRVRVRPDSELGRYGAEENFPEIAAGSELTVESVEGDLLAVRDEKGGLWDARTLEVEPAGGDVELEEAGQEALFPDLDAATEADFSVEPDEEVTRPTVLVGHTRSGKMVQRLQEEGWGRIEITSEENAPFPDPYSRHGMGGYGLATRDLNEFGTKQRLSPYDGEPWAIDSGAYKAATSGNLGRNALENGTDERFYGPWLERVQEVSDQDGPAPFMVVLPDIPFHGSESLAVSEKWLGRAPEGMPYYLPVQNGMTTEEVGAWLDRVDADSKVAGIFLGGDDAFKSEEGQAWVDFAHERGMKLHYGRAGTLSKLQHAVDIGADSIDSAFPLWTEARFEEFVRAWRGDEDTKDVTLVVDDSPPAAPAEPDADVRQMGAEARAAGEDRVPPASMATAEQRKQWLLGWDQENLRTENSEVVGRRLAEELTVDDIEDVAASPAEPERAAPQGSTAELAPPARKRTPQVMARPEIGTEVGPYERELFGAKRARDIAEWLETQAGGRGFILSMRDANRALAEHLGDEAASQIARGLTQDPNLRRAYKVEQRGQDFVYGSTPEEAAAPEPEPTAPAEDEDAERLGIAREIAVSEGIAEMISPEDWASYDRIIEIVDQARRDRREGRQPTAPESRPKIQEALGDFREAATSEDVQQLFTAARQAVEDVDTAPRNPTQITRWADEVLGKSYEAGDYQLDDVYDAFEGAVNQKVIDMLGPQERAGEPHIRDRLQTLVELENLYFRGRVNTGAAKERQQFSTPLPIAEAATYVAGVRPNDKVLEPSAGTGNLVNALRGMPAKVDVNELDPRRASILRELRFEQVTEQDALRLPLTGKRYNVVITNPPYGSIKKGKYSGFGAAPFNATDISQRFFAAAMQSLADGGRIVAVMPENTIRQQSTAFRQWLQEEHTPIAYIRSPEGSYRSRGVRSGSVIVVADKGRRDRPPSPLILDDDQTTWDDWLGAIEKFSVTGPYFRNARLETAEDVAPVVAPEPEPAAAPEEEAAPAPEPDPVAEAADRIASAIEERLSRQETQDVATTSAGQPEEATDVAPGTGVAPARGERDRGDSGPDESARGPGARTAPGEGDTGVVAEEAPGDVGEAEAERQEPVVPLVPRRRVEARPGDPEQRRREIEAANDSPVFAPYAVGVESSRAPHPRLVVETRSMAGMPAPPIDADFSSQAVLDAWGRDGAKGGISDEQADQALRALTAWRKGHGFLDAADVGVGKTRIAASLILEAIEQGETRIIYTTKNQTNVADAIDEFRRVATGDVEGELPFTVIEVGQYKDVKAGTADLPQPNGPVVYVAHSYNFADFAEALKDVNPTVWLADEAHEYKNIAGSNRGLAWSEVHSHMLDRGAAKFAYFTATPAVTLDELGYLYGLRLWPVGGFGEWVNRKIGKSTGETDQDEVKGVIASAQSENVTVGESAGIDLADDRAAKTGKQPFMRAKRDAFATRVTPAETEQVMREMKGSGHYVSVDLWRGGIEFNVEEIDMLGDTPEAVAMRKRYNEAAELVRDISFTARKFGRLNKRDKKGGLERSMIQGYMKQLLFELRLPRVLDLADEALADGKQVVISVHSVAGDGTQEVGVSLEDSDAPLNKRLESAINAINTEEVDKQGEGAEAVYVPVGDIPEALIARAELLDRLREMPPLFDPIRRIEDHFGQEKVAAITGRATAPQRTQLMGEFQSGQRQVAIISPAGKIGISLHDVNGAQRRMIVADYEWSADTFKQELGRTDRTGQKSSPDVVLVASNTAGERKFAATIAARMASLGATSKGSAESTGTDALDQFDMSGDIALEAMRNAVEKMDNDDRQFFTGSKFTRWTKTRDGGEHLQAERRPDSTTSMRHFLLEMLMFPVEVSDDVMRLWEQQRDFLMTGEASEKLAARRTARSHGQVLRVTPLAEDPPLVMYEVKTADGKKAALLQGFVTEYINEIQNARGREPSTGSPKTRRYVQFNEDGGDLITGLELNTAEASRVLKFFGSHTRVALTPEDVWNDLQLGEKIDVQGPEGVEWTLHPRRDERIQIMGATISKHQEVLKRLRDVVGYEPKGNFLFVKPDQESLSKFLEHYPPQASMEEEADAGATEAAQPATDPQDWNLPKSPRGSVTDLDALEAYFTPGEVVPSYFGRDKVVAFRRVGDGFEVDAQDADAPGSPIRTHGTAPTRREFDQVMQQRGLRGNPEAGFLINPFREVRKKDDVGGTIASSLPEVEERWQAARGIQDPTLRERVGQSLEDIKTAFRRHYRHLNPDNLTEALVADILRQYESSPAWAKAQAYDDMSDVVQGLSKKEVELMGRLLILPDIQKDIEAGLYEDKELPFGYPSAEAIEADLVQFDAQATPAIREAIERRQELNRRVTEALVQEGLLGPDVLEDDRYYHRQVMQYMEIGAFTGTGTGGDVRMRTKGFQRARAGGSDFNTRYEQAEFEWLSQAYALIARKQTLDRVRDAADIRQDLKREAKGRNLHAIDDQFGEGFADQLTAPFRRSIARGTSQLMAMAADGSLDPGESFGSVVDEMASAADAGASGEFQHEDWWPFLSWMASQPDHEGGVHARSIFKAIRDRETAIRGQLGARYIDWRDADALARLRPGYRTWQPEKGNHFFMGKTIPEQVLQQVLAGETALDESMVRQMLVVGGPKETWIVPDGVAATLERFNEFMDVVPDRVWRGLISSWKQWTLLNPARVLKYNLNNMSGDLDITLAYDPKIASKYLRRAIRELRKGKSDLINEARRRGVIDSGFSIAEVQDISNTGIFKILTDDDPNAFQKAVEKYWDSVRGATTFRENMLRMASYLYFQDQIAEGKTVYGASHQTEVDAVRDPGDRAAKLARELIGDYGNISHAGRWLRTHMFPFYSWMEINAPRYVRLMKNSAVDEVMQRGGVKRDVAAAGAKMGARVATRSAVSLMLRAGMLYTMIALYNKLVWPEEEEELRELGERGLHLILGRDAEGEVRSIRFEGALGDMLEWLNLADLPQDMRDLLDERKDMVDMAAEAVKAPVERLVNAMEPVTKTVFELALGASAYPTFFEEGKSFRVRPRTIRDPLEHAASTASLAGLYRTVTGRPARGDMFDRVAGLLVYHHDLDEASYWTARGLAEDWINERGGSPGGGGRPTRRSNALYYYKQALRWGDEDAAERWRTRYFELGGTTRGMEQSIRMSHPLGLVAQDRRPAFMASLSSEDREVVQRAVRWHQEVYGRASSSRRGPAPARPARPSRPAPPLR